MSVTDYYSPDAWCKPLNILAVGDGFEGVGNPALPIPESTTQAYLAMQNMLNICVNNAESINTKLLMFLQKKATNSAEAKALFKKDFMGLRDLFSEYLKRLTPLKNLAQFNSKAKLSAVTVTMNNFVLDRNIYTHGRLLILIAENKFLIEYIKDDDRRYAEVTPEILKSYNNTYRQLLTFLNIVEVITNPNMKPEELTIQLEQWDKRL